MRFLAALLGWLVATAALAVAVPAVWTQRHLVDAGGYATLAQRAATDPELQSAMAAELAARATKLINEGGQRVDAATVREVATGYTTGRDFPAQFGQANRLAHAWMFTEDPQAWTVDLAPMLRDSGFAELLSRYHVEVPDSIPLTLSPPDGARSGALRPLATWGPRVSIGVSALAGIGAVLTLIVARRRGRALAGLGVSALLAGAGGYAGIEVARRRLDDALGSTSDNVHRIADALVGVGVRGLQQWLLVTLAAGGGLVLLGVVVAMLGGLRKA